MVSKTYPIDIPDPLPESIDSEAAWYGPDMEQRTDWIHKLTEDEVGEIRSAVREVLDRDMEITDIRQQDFVLPTLSARLQKILFEVIHGRGFALLRGLPVGDWTIRESAIAYFGLGTHMGRVMSQNARGHVLGHIRDLGKNAKTDPTARVYETAERQTYHTDRCDIVGLLCLQTAKSGGASSLVSSVTIYNELRRRTPELVRTLFEPYPMDRRGEVGPGQEPFSMTPVFTWCDNLLSTYFVGRYIESASRFKEARPLTAKHAEAMKQFEDLTNDPAIHMNMEFNPGDVQLVYNHTLLHDRTAFIDWPEEHRKRHLLRLWLSVRGDRQLASIYEDRWGSIEIGNRGGVVPECALNAPLVAN